MSLLSNLRKEPPKLNNNERDWIFTVTTVHIFKNRMRWHSLGAKGKYNLKRISADINDLGRVSHGLKGESTFSISSWTTWNLKDIWLVVFNVWDGSPFELEPPFHRGNLKPLKTQTFTLWFETLARLQLWSSNKSNFVAGGHAIWGKGCSIRKAENHCSPELHLPLVWPRY